MMMTTLGGPTPVTCPAPAPSANGNGSASTKGPHFTAPTPGSRRSRRRQHKAEAELQRERQEQTRRALEEGDRAKKREAELEKQVHELESRLSAASPTVAPAANPGTGADPASDLAAQLDNCRTRLAASICLRTGAPQPARSTQTAPSLLCRLTARAVVVAAAAAAPGGAQQQQGSVEATWDLGAVKPTPKDWVGLYIHDREFNNKFSATAWTGGRATGSVTFPGLKDGFYDCRLFLGGTLVDQARSQPVLVGSLVRLDVSPAHTEGSGSTGGRAWEVAWEDTSGAVAQEDDWVGMFRAGTKSNKKWLCYQYCGPNDSLIFAVPRVPGGYEFRYFKAGSGNVYSGKTQVVCVQNEDRLSQIKAGEGFVAWKCLSLEPSKRDWIGLYESPSSDSTKYLQSRYAQSTDQGGRVDPSGESGEVLFDSATLSKAATAASANNYEIRFFSSAVGKYTPLLKAPFRL